MKWNKITITTYTNKFADGQLVSRITKKHVKNADGTTKETAFTKLYDEYGNAVKDTQYPNETCLYAANIPQPIVYISNDITIVREFSDGKLVKVQEVRKTDDGIQYVTYDYCYDNKGNQLSCFRSVNGEYDVVTCTDYSENGSLTVSRGKSGEMISLIRKDVRGNITEQVNLKTHSRTESTYDDNGELIYECHKTAGDIDLIWKQENLDQYGNYTRLYRKDGVQLEDGSWSYMEESTDYVYDGKQTDDEIWHIQSWKRNNGDYCLYKYDDRHNCIYQKSVDSYADEVESEIWNEYDECNRNIRFTRKTADTVFIEETTYDDNGNEIRRVGKTDGLRDFIELTSYYPSGNLRSTALLNGNIYTKAIYEDSPNENRQLIKHFEIEYV